MAIDYVEIRADNTELRGIVDTAKSIIWRSVYFGVGDFEIHVQANPDMVALLQAGNLVTRPDDPLAHQRKRLYVGIIEGIRIEGNEQDGKMVTATGRFAKCILERRLIYNLSGNVNTPTTLRGNVEEEVRRVITENAINCPFDSRRNIPLLALGDVAGLPHIIVNENGVAATKQVSYQNLLKYTDELLQEYELGATVILDEDAAKLCYVIYEGTDHSWDNAAGNDPIVFSEAFDNFTVGSYEYSEATEKNTALIGGEGEGLERFYSLLAGAETGLQRRELWVDASSLTRTYKNEIGDEHTYDDSAYRNILHAEGKQKLAASPAVVAFDGTIDIQNSRWEYNSDFSLGDIVSTQDDAVGGYVSMRLREVLEVQDENGYSIEANTKA